MFVIIFKTTRIIVTINTIILLRDFLGFFHSKVFYNNRTKKILNPFPQKKIKKLQSEKNFLDLICDDNFSTWSHKFFSVRTFSTVRFWTFFLSIFEFSKKLSQNYLSIDPYICRDFFCTIFQEIKEIPYII